MEQFGKYQIEEVIGEGGFGTVYRAVDTSLDRPVALKVLEPLLTRDATWVSRFQREARLLARLDHPHIVPIYETGEQGGRLFIAMKLIEGPDLRQVIAERAPLPWDEILRILRPVADALDYAHRNGIVHRDMKPGNILLGPYGPMLTDFGFARLVSEHSLSSSISGGVVGTPAYIAPEVWEGNRGEAPADIYALACVVAEMASGRALFQGENTPAVMLAHFRPPVLPDEWPAGVPQGLNDLLEQALNREPAVRSRNASEFAANLVGLNSTIPATEAVGASPTTSHLAQTSPPTFFPSAKVSESDIPDTSGRSRRLIAGSIAVLLLALVGLATSYILLKMFDGNDVIVQPEPSVTDVMITALPSITGQMELGSADNPIIMSFVPSGDTQDIIASGEELARLVSEQTGLTVEANVGTDFAAVREAMCANQAQIGWLNTFNYVLANEVCGVDAGLVTERFGATFYNGQIVVGADSGIESLEDLQGKVMCWVDPRSNPGYIIPRIMLAANGLDPDTMFSQTIEAGSHNNVIAQVYNGDCDAGATFVDARSFVEEDLPDVNEKVVVLATTTDIPNDSVAFTKNFPTDVREKIVAALLEIAASEEGRAILNTLYSIDSLSEADDSIYDSLRADLRRAAIDIEELVD